MNDEAVGDRYWPYHVPSDEEILSFTLEPPSFERGRHDVEAEIRAKVGREKVSKSMQRPHNLIGKLLKVDEERKENVARKGYLSDWELPQFDSAFERRRLRFLNAIFAACIVMG